MTRKDYTSKWLGLRLAEDWDAMEALATRYTEEHGPDEYRAARDEAMERLPYAVTLAEDMAATLAEYVHEF